MDTPFRRSIWQHDSRYDIDEAAVTRTRLRDVGRLQSIEAAKKRTPPVPFRKLMEIAETIRALPHPKDISEDVLIKAIEQIVSWGIGMKTAFCMIAGLTDGEYAPLDVKILTGLKNQGLISSKDQSHLSSSNHKTVCRAYLSLLLPLWRRRVESGDSPEEIDIEWAISASR